MARFLTLRFGKSLVHVRQEADHQFLVFNPHTNSGVRLDAFLVFLLAEVALGNAVEKMNGGGRLCAEMKRIGVHLTPP